MINYFTAISLWCVTKLRTLTFVALASLACFHAFPQAQWTGIIPQTISPRAYEFTKYVDVPVGTYTGVPVINIPLYTLKANGLDIPIAVSYHSNGIKVNEEASWVGLGFSLNAGGSIVQSVNDFDDFGNNTGHVDPSQMTLQPGQLDCLGGGTADFAEGDEGLDPIYTTGRRDTKPDVFVFSFLNYSGQFFYDYEQEKFINLGDPNIIITSDFSQSPDLQSFDISVPEGHKFHFVLMEITTITKMHGWSAPVNHGLPSSDFLLGSASSRLFRLQAIYTNLGDEILFHYKQPAAIANYPSISQVNTKNVVNRNGSNNQGPDANEIFPGNTTAVTMTATSQQQSYLDYILTKKVRIDFVSSANRTDMIGAYRLDRVLVSDNVTPVIGKKVFDFSYGYFEGQLQGNTIDEYFDELYLNKTDDEKKLRLKLLSIKEEGSSSYQFGYSDVALPGKTSLAFDHWGLYNGSLNSTLTYRLGSNRDFAQAGILTSIKYPTGGQNKFEYELNDISDVIQQIPVYKMESGLVVVNDQNYNSTPYPNNYGSSIYRTSPRSFWIVVPDRADVTRHPVLSVDGSCSSNLNYYEYLAASWEIRSYNTDALELVKQQGWGAIPYFVSNPDYITNISVNRIPYTGPTGSRFKDFGPSVGILPAGVYFFSVNLDDACGPQNTVGQNGMAFLSLDYSQRVIDHYETRKQQGAGLRVKSVKMYEFDLNVAKSRMFVYDDPKLMSQPDYTAEDPFHYEYEKVVVGPDGEIVSCNLHEIQGTSYSAYSQSVLVPSTNAAGKYVGYGRTEEYFVDFQNNNEPSNGKKISFYTNEVDRNFNHHVPGWRQTTENGLLTKEQYINVAGDTIREIAYNYETEVWPCYYGSTVYWLKRTWFLSMACFNYFKNYYRVGFYPLVRAKTYLKVQKIRYRAGNQILTEERRFTYDSHRQISIVSFEDSQNQLYETTSQYPYDYVSSGDAMASKMVAENHISTPMSIETRKNATPINFQRSEFCVVNTSSLFGAHEYFDKSAIYSKNGNGPLEKMVEFQRFDKGKILQYKTVDGLVTSLIWGYKGECIVAKVVGATYDETIQFVNLQVLERPQTKEALHVELDKIRAGLPRAFVTTFSHDAVYGMTSERDPNGLETTYEYDPYGRLKLVADHAGNIMTTYSYGFRK